MIDLRGNPFFLTEAQCRRVREVLESLSTEEKTGQLMHVVSAGDDEEALLSRWRAIPFGGLTFRAERGRDVRRKADFLQRSAKVPMLVSANLESGGTGIATDGTEYATETEAAAAGDPAYAETLGEICGAEGAAAGVNLAFAPVVDILCNWRNPIIGTRTFGSDPDRVLAMASAYLRGIRRHRVAVSIKHFPGDGVDERDQHLTPSVNSLGCEEWEARFGKVYRGLIAQGAETVMVGHILQPAWSRRLRPGIRDEEILPASLSRELVEGLLRGRLGFSGVVFTDSAVMTGLSCSLPRREIPAACINAGCDVFLFGRNEREDYENLLADVKSGVVSAARLDEAVTRVLALKASLGLLDGSRPEAPPLETLGCRAHREAARRCADEAITLVKDTQGLLPLSPERHRRVWLHILGDEPTFRGGMCCREMVLERLRAAGFQVTLFDRTNPREALTNEPVSELKKRYDLILYVANTIFGGNDTVNRIRYVPLACGESPQYVRDIPTLFVSLGNPFHLADVPMIKTFVNCYQCSPAVLDSLMEKLLGRDGFRGVSPVDPFCGIWGTAF